MASQKRVETIWDKARSIRGQNPNIYRKDDFGNIILKQSYGTKGEYGWEIDHKNPKSKGERTVPKICVLCIGRKIEVKVANIHISYKLILNLYPKT